MRAKQKSPIWPYLGILACLFVLSITAPRAWDRMAQRELELDDLADQVERKVAQAIREPESYEPLGDEELTARAPLEPALPPPSQAANSAETTTLEEDSTLDEDSTPEHSMPIESQSDSSLAETSETFNLPAAPPVVSPRLEPTVEAPAIGEWAIPQPEFTQQVGARASTADQPKSEETSEALNSGWTPVATAVAPSATLSQPRQADLEESNAGSEPAPEPAAAQPLYDQPVSEHPIAGHRIADRLPAEAAAAEPPAEPVYEAVMSTSAWPMPRVLLEQLGQLSQEDSTSLWSRQAIELIHRLCQPDPSGRDSTDEILSQLRGLSERPSNVAAVDLPLEIEIARARYALTRWLDVWQPAAQLESMPFEQRTAADADEMATVLTEIDALVRRGKPGAAWREYLQLDALRRLEREATGSSDSVQQRQELARKLLDRLNSSRLSKSQRKFLTSGPLAALQKQLRAWANDPLPAGQVLKHLEQYERSGLPSDAKLAAQDLRRLRWSSPSEAEELSQRLDTHYRNANLRVVVRAPLLNRMVPQPEKVESPVRDTVMNVPVYGHSTTFTRLNLRLVPDPTRIRLGLEANGLVASDTVATSGPATLYNEGQSTFLVRKLLVIGPSGMSVWPAIAEAENNYNYLVSLETEYDGVPLFGSLVRSIARSQHEQAKGEARMEVEHKVATRAKAQLDAEVDPRLTQAAEKLQKNQMATLSRMGLELVPVGLTTTEDRIMARLRLGSNEQLGAHTPRPRAPSDSWFSMQVHQSALNNGLEKLDLDGRTFKLPDLFAWIGKKLNHGPMNNVDDLPEDVKVTFARQDAVRLRCDDDRIEITLAFAELKQGRHTWRNFTVRTHYVPQPSGLEPRFSRDAKSAISLEGKEVSGKPVPILRSIFSKVLSRNRDLRLLDESMTSDPRVQDLEITQFSIDDGWIALAYSPRRVPSSVARRGTAKPETLRVAPRAK